MADDVERGMFSIRTILPYTRHNEAPSPFTPGTVQQPRRPLSITIHVPTIPLEANEQFALRLIRELASRPSVEGADTMLNDDAVPSRLTRVAVAVGPNGGADVTVTPYDGEPTTTHYFGDGRDRWKDEAIRLGFREQLDEVLPELHVLGLHRVRRADLLVTTSEVLLRLRANRQFQDMNICAPSEAVGILGLYLRSQNDYAISAGGMIWDIGRSGFYDALSRTRLPQLLPYSHRCVHASRSSGDESLQRLSGTVWSRADWALQALDAIGTLFQQPVTHQALDDVLYHFNYLLLLLLGMFDAQARIARRVYRLSMKDRQSSFWRSDFVTAIDDAGGKNLAAVARRPDLISLGALLKDLRNTIHGASLEGQFHKHRGAAHRSGAIIVERDDATKIWNAASAMGGAAAWGIVGDPSADMKFEPYPYARRLVGECFRVVNEIAEATDFPGAPVQTPSDPSDSLFGGYYSDEEVLRRVATLAK